MKLKNIFITSIFLSTCYSNFLYAEGLEGKQINVRNNERFSFVEGSAVQFKFKPLTDEARALKITEDASSLGVAYLGKLQLKENFTPLAALRSIGDQIGNSLDISFGVIADSNTSEALKANELLLLYHPLATVTLALVKTEEENQYEIICTYALKELKPEVTAEQTENSKNTDTQATAFEQ